MFDNATMFMMFILLCFAGLLVMFYFVLRGMDELSRSMRDEHATLVSGLRTLEVRVNELARAQRAAAAGLPAMPQAGLPGDAGEPVDTGGHYHVQYGTGPDARHDAGRDALYDLGLEEELGPLPAGLAVEYDEPVELRDRQGESGHENRAEPRAGTDVELPRLDLGGMGTGTGSSTTGANPIGLDTDALDTSAFAGGGHEYPDERPRGIANGPDLLTFGDDRAAQRSAREGRAGNRATRQGHGGLPELKLED